MNIKKINQELMTFWDGFFKQNEPMTIKREDIKIENDLDVYIKEVADQCLHILDLGTGSGYAILQAALLGKKMKTGIAIDPSPVAIEILNQTLKNSHITNIKTIIGTHHDLTDIPDHSIDGVLSSNVLDVVPFETSEEMIKLINRVLKVGGLFMLKLNFFLTEDIIKRTKAEEISPNTYTINGVVRAHNLSTEDWIKRFSNFELLKQSTFERIKDGPLDRVLLFKKIS